VSVVGFRQRLVVQHCESTFRVNCVSAGKRMYPFRISAASYGFLDGSIQLCIYYGELAGARTQDPRLKRALLYQLSYELTYISTYLDSIK
jgi:hypothetical protein